MIQRILLAVDGPDSWSAAAGVLELVAAAGPAVEVEVLHVNEVEYQTPDPDADSDDFCAQAKVRLDTLVDELQSQGVAAWGRMRSGMYDNVADDIVAEAKEFGADIIVVGSRPRSDLSCWIKGSVSHAVLRRAVCPVLVTRETRVRV
jgi:nucleotide-binding universal stress UspA family protein